MDFEFPVAPARQRPRPRLSRDWMDDRPGMADRRKTPRNRQTPAASTAHPAATPAARPARPPPSTERTAQGPAQTLTADSAAARRDPRPNGCRWMDDTSRGRGRRLMTTKAVAQTRA